MSNLLRVLVLLTWIISFTGCGDSGGTTQLPEMPPGTPAPLDPADDPNTAVGPGT